MGCGPVAEDGRFDDDTEQAVQLFQARSVDTLGIPLVVDGKVGPLTWGALFGAAALPVLTAPPGSVAAKLVEVASAEVGVMESPAGSNRGPRVDQYVRSVGLNPTGGFAWCAAFLYFCFEKACAELGAPNPVIKTAGVQDHWQKAGQKGIPRITHAEFMDDASRVQPGHVFVIGFPKGLGHTGLVEAISGGRLITIEGNTNQDGSRNGVGVFRRDKRKISDINLGLISYI